MKKRLLLTAVTLSMAPSLVTAKNDPFLAPFSTLCLTETTAGLRWVKDHWETANYTLYHMLVHKLPWDGAGSKTNTGTPAWACGVQYQGEKTTREGSVITTYGCYGLMRIGEDKDTNDRICAEKWHQSAGGGDATLQSIECELIEGYSVRFLPNGWMHGSAIGSASLLDEANPKRDSLWVSARRCKVMGEDDAHPK